MAHLRRLLTRCLDIHRNKGIGPLAVTVAQFLTENATLQYSSFVRSLFPVTRPYEINDVQIPESVWYSHVKYDDYIPFYPPSACQVWGEEGVIKSHHAVTDQDDDVVIVGGGFGVTAVCAARELETGSLTVFEASSSQATVVRETLALNDVATEWSVQERTVGSDVFELYGDSDRSSADLLRPSSLPECDILELDCEGSELSILKNLVTRPRALIVEIHPYKGGYNPIAVLDELKEMKYEIIRRHTHLGAELTHKQLLRELRKRVNTHGSGLPPVIAAIHNG